MTPVWAVRGVPIPPASLSPFAAPGEPAVPSVACREPLVRRSLPQAHGYEPELCPLAFQFGDARMCCCQRRVAARFCCWLFWSMLQPVAARAFG
jgi:hypothetical protein